MALACQAGHVNIEGAFFCETCGERLGASATPTSAQVCLLCGSPNAPDAARCLQCGRALNEGGMAKPITAQPRLVIVATGTILDFAGKDSVLLGRSDPTSDLYPDIDFTLHGGEENGVSRRHAFVRRVRDHFELEDQQSVNKTFLNKQRLEAFKPAKLKHGDEVRLGKLVMRFELA